MSTIAAFYPINVIKHNTSSIKYVTNNKKWLSRIYCNALLPLYRYICKVFWQFSFSTKHNFDNWHLKVHILPSFFLLWQKRLVFKQYIEHLFEQAKRFHQGYIYPRIKIDKNVLLFKTSRFLFKKNHQKNINFKLVRKQI